MALPNKVPVSVVFLRACIRTLSVILPALAVRLVYKIWFHSPRYKQPLKELQWQQGASTHLLKTESGEIALYEWGDVDRPVVILVHGWSGRATQLAASVSRLLEEGYAVVAFDAPGHGASSGNYNSIFKQASVLGMVANRYKHVDTVIAHSFGVLVSLYAINRDYLLPEKLVCISSPSSLNYLLSLFTRYMRIPDKIVLRLVNMLLNEFGQTLFDDVSGLENARELSLPGLVIHDRNDADVECSHSQMLCDVWPKANCHFTEKLGHRRILRNEKVIELIIKFIKQDDQFSL